MASLRARPASDLTDLLSREPGTRLLLPPLTVVGYNAREIRYADVEQTMHDYRFQVSGETSTWEIEYSGSYHYHWTRGRQVLLVATIKRHSRRWRCTRIARPVEQSRGDVPLFG